MTLAFNAPQCSPTRSIDKVARQGIHVRAADSASAHRPYLLSMPTPESPSLPLPLIATSGGAVQNHVPEFNHTTNPALTNASDAYRPASFLKAKLKLPLPRPSFSPRGSVLAWRLLSLPSPLTIMSRSVMTLSGVITVVVTTTWCSTVGPRIYRTSTGSLLGQACPFRRAPRCHPQLCTCS